MIDEKSSDYSCIYTTMMFVDAQARKHGKIPLLTFDRPLYWKAFEILAKLMKEVISCDIVYRKFPHPNEFSRLNLVT